MKNHLRLGRIHADVLDPAAVSSFIGPESGFGAPDRIVTTIYIGGDHDCLTLTWTVATARAFAALLTADADRCGQGGRGEGA